MADGESNPLNPYLSPSGAEGLSEANPQTAPQGPPRVWPAFLLPFAAFAVVIVLQIVVVVGLILMAVAGGQDANAAAQNLTKQLAQPPVFLTFLVAGQLAFLLTLLVPVRLSPIPFRERLNIAAPRQGWSICLWTSVASIPFLAIALFSAVALAKVIPADESVGALFANLTPLDAVFFVTLIAVLPGVIEELFFRGYIQTRLIQRYGPVAGILLASTLFAIAHVMPHAVLLAFILGIWLGVVAWRTGSVIPGMFCHAFINGGLNLWRVIVKFGEIPESTQTIVHIALIAIGCVALAVTAWKLADKQPA